MIRLAHIVCYIVCNIVSILLGGIEYLPGGVESGFQKVERDVYPTRLLQLKGY